MIKKFGLPEERCDMDLAGFFVIVYWMVCLGPAYIFENTVIFLIMPMALLSFYTVSCVNVNSLASGKDYLIGTILMFAGLAVLQRGNPLCLQSNRFRHQETLI